MARGKERHDARQAAVAALGKNLSRRAGSRCELCGADTELRVFEVLPDEEGPHEEAAILACGRCRGHFDARRLHDDELRHLEGVAWSEVAPVQLAAVLLLRRLADAEVGWARDLLDTLWIPDEVRDRLPG